MFETINQVSITHPPFKPLARGEPNIPGSTVAATRPLKLVASPTSSSKMVAQAHFLGGMAVTQRRGTGNLRWKTAVSCIFLWFLMVFASRKSHFNLTIWINLNKKRTLTNLTNKNWCWIAQYRVEATLAAKPMGLGGDRGTNLASNGTTW